MGINKIGDWMHRTYRRDLETTSEKRPDLLFADRPGDSPGDGRGEIGDVVMIPERETGRLPFHSLSMGEAIREIDIFSGMSDRQTDVIASIGHMLEIPLGQELGRVGERGSHLFAIISGRAQLSAGSGLGEITVRIVGPGETFPLAALIESGTLVTTAKAMTDMELIAVPCEQLREMCARDPDLGMRIYEAIATVFQRRYRKTLVDLSASAQKALREAGFFTNV